ncbi:MAG TPA: ABC transporter substrate-binding protein [Methanospirillum sp.]|nr:ABC transporter substrate-binding protein [Methanospirillum sp.]
MTKQLMMTGLCLSLVLLLLCAGCTTQEKSAAPEKTTADKQLNKDTSTPQAPAAAGMKVYKVGIDVPYPPFSMMDEKGVPTGFDVESLRWIAKDQGFEPDFQVVAWDGIIPALQAGKIDMVYSGMTITDERKEKVNFSKSYWTVNQMVVAKAGSSITLDQVKAGKASIGTQRGCTAAIWAEDNLVNKTLMPAENLKQYDNTPLAVEDLAAGRIDVVMYDSTVMNDIIAGKPVMKVGMIETNEQFGIAVRKDDTVLLEKLDAGLTHLMASPDWKALIQKYKME